MKTAKSFYRAQDHNLKVNADTTKKTWQISMPEGGFYQIYKTGSRILEYFNVLIANHSAGMPQFGHFYNYNPSYNLREIMVTIRWLFLCFDSWQCFVSALCSAYSKRFVSPGKEGKNLSSKQRKWSWGWDVSVFTTRKHCECS
jgi:hypothetical protein